MTAVNRNTLKAYFESGDRPTQAQFGDLIDSCANLAEASTQSFAGSIFSPLVSATRIEAAVVSAGSLVLTQPVSAISGGTGLNTYVAGDMLYAATNTTLARLAAVAVGQHLLSTGVSAPPAYGSVLRTNTFTRDLTTATGTQAITGLGFKPTHVIITANLLGNAAASLGFDDAASSTCIYNDHNDSANTWGNSATKSIILATTGAASYQGLIQSMDSDGFTLSWTKNGSPTGTARMNFVAFR